MVLIIKGNDREKRFGFSCVKDGRIVLDNGENYSPTCVEVGEEELEAIRASGLTENYDIVKKYSTRYILRGKGYKTISGKNFRNYKVKFNL